MQPVPRNSAENPHPGRWHAACCRAEVKGTGMRHNTLVCTLTILVLTFAASANAIAYTQAALDL